MVWFGWVWVLLLGLGVLELVVLSLIVSFVVWAVVGFRAGGRCSAVLRVLGGLCFLFLGVVGWGGVCRLLWVGCLVSVLVFWLVLRCCLLWCVALACIIWRWVFGWLLGFFVRCGFFCSGGCGFG